MGKELVISSNRHETKLAVLEDDQLVEIYFQRANEYSLAGSIHKGRVTRVLPGMQSAFVDLGLERDTFLYVSDFFEENEEYDRIPGGGEERPSRGERAERPERAERAERPERFDRAEKAEPAAAPSGGERPERTPAVQAQPSAAEKMAATTPAERGEEGGDGRDRRGRRSRRRRTRGRGFPDSKYASDVTAQKSEAPEAEAEVEEISAPAEDLEFPVLPGESLAKYRRPKSDSEDDEEDGQPDASAAGENGNGEEDQREPDLSYVKDEIAEIEAERSAALEEELAESAGETGEVEAEEAGPEETTGETETAEVSETIAMAPEEEEEPVRPYEDAVVTEEAAAFVSETAAYPVLEESAEPEIERPEDAESAEVEAETFADEIAAAADEAEQEVELETRAEGAEGVAPSEAAAGGSASATVREHNARYLHRAPRRTRRKVRGGGAPEPRAETERRPPAGRAAEAPKPEPRTVTRPEKGVMPSITELLREGQEILVQIAKEPLGQKGARITSHIALPGRYVVYMPSLEHTGVSRKIASDEERLRLKRILQTHTVGIPGGFIVRTAGEGKTEDEIAADMNFLFNLWLDIRQKAEKLPAPALIHHDLEIVQRILRDQLNDEFKAIWTDSEEIYERVLRFVQRFQPALVPRVKMYTRKVPMFDSFNITAELEKALRPKVWLKSGGYIVINQTEALLAIDVNTGKFVGKSNRLEDTIVKTNTEAVKEIVRQMRLRDLGGIIVVDFIDMDERKNRQKVMQTLEEAMRADRAPYKILQFNDFGLVAITRKRVKQSLERTLCSPCPYCEGAGYVKSIQTVISEILQEAVKITDAVKGNQDVVLRVNPEVARELKSTGNKYLEELEEILGCSVLVRSDPVLHQEKFDLA